ncbi:MAG TPA: DUF1254 domain-containing protein [Vicinamibacterales bacterium]
MNLTKKAILVATALALSAPLSRPIIAADITPEDAREIAVEAYIYLYPLVMMDVTRRVTTNVPPGAKPGLGPMNTFQHMRTYPDANFREVVRPNFDTLYSIAWLDLTGEPMIVSVPDTSGRYYLLPVMDMWTDVFAVPGKRTSGTSAASYAFVPAGWTGTLPAGVERIDSPTPLLWIVGRTQTNGPKDYDAVHAVQDGFKVVSLSQFGRPSQRTAAFTPDPAIDMKTPPLNQVNGMPAAQYFAYAAELMKLHKPHVTDWSMIARLRRIGIVPGKSFDITAVDPMIRQALEQAPAEALKRIAEVQPKLAKVVNGWQMNTDTMGAYGNFYLKRASIAMVGLGANQVEDAIYPMNLSDADGKPLDGGKRYVLHFDKKELPPVGAFWSVTMYDAEGFQAANPINRFAIGDRDALKYNPDGSLDIYIQHDSPGAARESNWLPSPTGPLAVTMRLYAPKAEALDGRWAPPPIRSLGQPTTR